MPTLFADNRARLEVEIAEPECDEEARRVRRGYLDVVSAAESAERQLRAVMRSALSFPLSRQRVFRLIDCNNGVVSSDQPDGI